jgi:hypothetical protein
MLLLSIPQKRNGLSGVCQLADREYEDDVRHRTSRSLVKTRLGSIFILEYGIHGFSSSEIIVAGEYSTILKSNW